MVLNKKRPYDRPVKSRHFVSIPGMKKMTTCFFIFFQFVMFAHPIKYPKDDY
jgi:hypothetical protein